MTATHPARRRAARRLVPAALAVVVVVVAVGASPATPAGANGLTWSVRWSASTTSAGPNQVSAPPQLSGTASPPVAGDPNRVDYSVTSSGLPAACAVPAGAAALDRQAFRFTPAFACNGTYTVTVVARSGTGLLASASPALTAPLALADPGPAPGALSGAVDGRADRVAVSWPGDPDPDVVGYRVRR
ncbi:MAG TPA: hypothetical protein VHK88_00970, partial [Aquihabitans sp.]|nr:hypothetical protein [Aquihabitans sp.]